MNKIGLVILNFLTYEDTYESIKTLSERLIRNVELNIYIVDNAANDIKYNKLKKDIDRLNIDFNIQYLASKKNLGFAKGMNIGIDKAREDGCNFVICSNNDIVYKNEIDFSKFIDTYNIDRSIAIIGPKILNLNGGNQNPYIIENKEKHSLAKLIKQKLIFTNPIGKLVFFLSGYTNIFFQKRKKIVIESSSQYVYALHGSFMVLTPAYFKIYDNLDPNTFLYNEELILAERVRQNNLKMFYLDELTVTHKDDSSTDKMLKKHSWKRLNFILNENYKSRSYFLKEYIWPDKKIYILHEYGANFHYRVLKHLCDIKDTKIIYREFSIGKSLIKSILKRDFQLLKKQFLNILFLINLLLTKNKKVVLGIAPYDFRLVFLSLILRNHKVYYHTSWTSWDRIFYPKKLFVSNWLIDFWESFIKNKVIKIFAVSQVTKTELIKHLNIEENMIIVVNHSFDDTIYNYKERDFKKRFLYVGRLEPYKGIDEILEYFSKKNNLSLTLVGDGSLTDKVKKFSNQYKNIKYMSFVSDQKKLAEIYNEHDILLLNSKKTENWEELFGMVLIEAMACGVIPIATNHKGPTEIITDGVDGFLSSEKDFISRVDTLVNSNLNFIKIRENAIKTAKKYSAKEIAKRWEVIFE